MINKKNKTYFFVVISFVCIVFIVGFHILDGRNITLFDPIIEYIKQYHIKDVVNIVAILSGISAILVGVASIRISNLGAVKEYFQQGDNKEYTTARHNFPPCSCGWWLVDGLQVPVVMRFFHRSAFLQTVPYTLCAA